jgi:hypothetical protein
MKLPQTGGCQCGKIHYEITEEPGSVYTCHCTACQRLTSSAFSMGLVVSDSAFRLSGIEPRSLQRIADSGRVQHPVGVSGMRYMDFRPAEGWRGPRACRHARRYVVATTDPAYLDAQQAALDHIRRGRSAFRGPAARVAQTVEQRRQADASRGGRGR